jgi:oligopeptide/dipeptide ABC transporter ATP-binding protein
MKADLSSNERPVLYRIEEVSKEFGRLTAGGRRDGLVRALDNVSFEIFRGETFGLVGESGSGKTTLGRLLVRFDRPTRGSIFIDDTPIDQLRGKDLTQFRQRVQMVYQNPFSSLNPRRTVASALSAAPAMRAVRRGLQREQALVDLLERVGLHQSMLRRYPHEFSGGQRQRIVIARALSSRPSVLVADEPVSALDAPIQSQVLDLLLSLKREFGLSIVMITHDLRVVNFFCDRVGVLYHGRLVELGERITVIERSSHPYTRMLMSAAPSGDPNAPSVRPLVRGELSAGPPDPNSCVFSDRCWLRAAMGRPERCASERPALRLLDSGHFAACHFAENVEKAALDVHMAGSPELLELSAEPASELSQPEVAGR